MRRRGFLQQLGVASLGGVVWGHDPLVASAAARAAVSARQRTLAAALLDAGGTLGLRLTRFDRSHVAAMAEVPLSPTARSTKLTMDGTTISCRARTAPARDRADAHDIEVVFHVARGRLSNATVAATLSLSRWSRDAYVMIPGAVYGGNRFASRHIPFPPLLSEPSDIGPHVPTIISDVPRLDNRTGESRIVLSAADAAVPTIAVRLTGPVGSGGGGGGVRSGVGLAADADTGGSAGLGVLLLAEPRTAIGQTSLSVSESADRAQATLALGTPSVRPDLRYSLCNSRVPSLDRGADLEVGSTVTLRFRLLLFPCPDVPTLFARWFEARRDRVGPANLRHDLPLSAARRLVEERLLADQWIEEEGIFAMRSPTILVSHGGSGSSMSGGGGGGGGGGARLESTFRTGADGALALTVPMLLASPAEARKRSDAVLDFQFRGQAPSGLFRAASNGALWWDEGEPAPGGTAAEARLPRRRWTHVGRNAEALHLGCKQLLLLQRIDPKYRLSDAWRKRLARAADALVRLWNRHNQLGQYAHTETGDIVVGGSAAGALAPAALALTARLLDAETYLRAAITVGEAFHGRFVEEGLTLGGAPAALQCPDSRSAAGLLESFTTLADATGDTAWFDKAAEVAHQLASWVVAWDAQFAEQTTLAKLGARTTGAVLVSAQDKWGLPGFAGLSGDALFRLYRGTGRVAYLELLRETVHNSTTYVATRDRLPQADAKAGWVAGRIPLGDALGVPGDVPDATPAGTAQASLLLGATEIPGLYVQPDTGFCFAFDHIDARVTARTAATLKVVVNNPTAYEAELRLFSELDADRARALPPFPLWGARSLTLGPGATEEVEFPLPAT